MELHVFHALVAAHIVTGTAGAVAFWVPVIGRKGGVNHKRWGRVFTYAMLATGVFAVGMSILTLIEPMGTHPHLVGMFDAVFIRAIFGWLMLHMGILTINLAWYGWLCIRNKRDRDANRTPLNLAPGSLFFHVSAGSDGRPWNTRAAWVAGSVMSPATASTRTPGASARSAAAASSSARGSRPLMTTFTPSLARACAQARPSPLLAAHTIACRPAMPRSMLFLPQIVCGFRPETPNRPRPAVIAAASSSAPATIRSAGPKSTPRARTIPIR